MFIHRALERVVRDISNTFPVLLVTGPRQVAEKERGYVTLNDPVARQLAKEEPSLFLQRNEAPVIIDEIQYAPELLPYIKVQVDRNGAGRL